MVQNCTTLNDLWEHVDDINKQHFPDNQLAPILGNGKTLKPKFMFVFINPTIRNISSDKDWKGPRFPFIGTKQIWRVFHRAGLFDDFLINQINSDSNWTLDFTDRVLKFLTQRSLYLTNIVKWTGSDAALPDSRKTDLFFPILKKEIEIVQPEYIITFGLIPFEKLTGRKIKLSDYYEETVKSGKLKTYPVQINSTRTKVIPCYFPTGRGKPKKAIELLKLLETL